MAIHLLAGRFDLGEARAIKTITYRQFSEGVQRLPLG